MVAIAGDGNRARKTGAEFLGRTCVLVYGPSGYEGNSGADAVQEDPTKPLKIQQIRAFELARFGCCGAAFSHRKGIGMPLAAGIAVGGDVGRSAASGGGLPILPFLGVDAR